MARRVISIEKYSTGAKIHPRGNPPSRSFRFGCEPGREGALRDGWNIWRDRSFSEHRFLVSWAPSRWRLHRNLTETNNLMTPRNLLRVVIAGIGFIGAGYGILYVLDALLYAFGLYQTQSSQMYTRFYAIRGLLQVLISYWVMRGADRIAIIAFPLEEDELAEEDEAEGAGHAE